MELLDVLVGVPLEPHLYERLDGESETGRIDDRGVALDDPRLLELADPACAWRMSEAYGFRQVHDRPTPVLLQFVQQTDVCSVEVHIKDH